MERVVKMALVGAGMFGGDVHLRACADLQRSGISPRLGRIGLDEWAREMAGIRFDLCAIATRTEPSARAAQEQYKAWSGQAPACYWGEQPWNHLLEATPDLDVISVATPDPLHTPVILAALKAGTHVLAEKPLCLDIAEADAIVELARASNRVVALDMHKRYDPDHLRIRQEIVAGIGDPLYGLAYLEEPLEVSASTFKWVRESDPFSYVGSHWVDLIYHYYRSKPVSLTAVGQKKLLASKGIDAYDAVQVRVDYANGMSIAYHNNWITPAAFEGPVNQGHELVGTRGKVESDQQYRGLRWWTQEKGSRTANTHFTRQIERPGEKHCACVGYGIDSLVAGLAAICRVKFSGASRDDLAPIYPTAEEGLVTVAIVHAARLVRDLNFAYLKQGKGATVSACFGQDGITLVDPNRIAEGAKAVFQTIHPKPV